MGAGRGKARLDSDFGGVGGVRRVRCASCGRGSVAAGEGRFSCTQDVYGWISLGLGSRDWCGCCRHWSRVPSLDGFPASLRPGVARRGIMEIEDMNLALHPDATQADGLSLVEVCRRYGVRELSLFGSAARGEMGPESDIDILVEFEPGVRIGLIRFESLVGELESLAGRRVDLVTKRGLKPWIRPQVLKDARVIFAA